jgi:hypothetical protein
LQNVRRLTQSAPLRTQYKCVWTATSLLQRARDRGFACRLHHLRRAGSLMLSVNSAARLHSAAAPAVPTLVVQRRAAHCCVLALPSPPQNCALE